MVARRSAEFSVKATSKATGNIKTKLVRQALTDDVQMAKRETTKKATTEADHRGVLVDKHQKPIIQK